MKRVLLSVFAIALIGLGAAYADGPTIPSLSSVIQFLVGTAPTPVSSSNPLPVTGTGGTVTVAPYAYTPLTPGQYTPVSDSAATALTAPAGATYAAVCVEGANHRYTWDGTTTPTASIGTLWPQSAGCLYLSGALAIANFKVISVTAGGTFTASYAK